MCCVQRVSLSLFVLLCFTVELSAAGGKIVTHSSHVDLKEPQQQQKQQQQDQEEVAEAESTKFRLSTNDLIDLEDGIPEQTVPERIGVSAKVDSRDDVTSHIIEMPEQTIADANVGKPAPQQLLELEEQNNDDNDNDDTNNSINKSKLVDMSLEEDDDAGNEMNPILGSDNINPLTQNSRPHVTNVTEQSRTMAQNADGSDSESRAEIKIGNTVMEILPKHSKNFLDASHVQIGTSLLGPSSNKPGEVAKYRIRFNRRFTQRPVILVTTVPEGAENENSVGPHPDVFVASVSDIGLDYFVVNIVRVDSMPHNGWGQQLFLDWIAMEYERSYPDMTPSTGEQQQARNLEYDEFHSSAEQLKKARLVDDSRSF